MDTSSFESPPPEVLLSRQDGRTPRVVHPPKHSFRGYQRLKKSTYYGILLFILDQDRGRLSENQIVWIIYYSRKLDESQLSRAVEIYKQLKFKDSFLSRMKHDVERIRSNVPRLEPKILPEKRRIGTGYHDKGSLRPLHEKRTIGERAIWDEDIVYLLPLDYQVRGTWLTAEEVCELVGVDHLQLVLHQLKTESLQESVVPSK
jgi:hypothetical protein